MEDEAKNGLSIPLAQVTDRIVKAVGISKNTVTKIRKEGNEIEASGGKFSTPNKKRRRESIVSKLDLSMEDFLRRHIHNYHRIHETQPNLSRLLLSMRQDGLFEGSKSSLRRLVKKLGFRYAHILTVFFKSYSQSNIVDMHYFS